MIDLWFGHLGKTIAYLGFIAILRADNGTRNHLPYALTDSLGWSYFDHPRNAWICKTDRREICKTHLKNCRIAKTQNFLSQESISEKKPNSNKKERRGTIFGTQHLDVGASQRHSTIAGFFCKTFIQKPWVLKKCRRIRPISDPVFVKRLENLLIGGYFFSGPVSLSRAKS